MSGSMNSLLHKLCWCVVAGGCTGSAFKLCLGEKIPREKPIPNENLDEQARLNDSEYSLMAYCAWRLDGPDGPITSWLEPNEPEGSMVMGLDRLVGDCVDRVEVFLPAGDLEVRFTRGKTLKIFCDKIATTGHLNWFVTGPNQFEVVAEKGSVSFSQS